MYSFYPCFITSFYLTDTKIDLMRKIAKISSFDVDDFKISNVSFLGNQIVVCATRNVGYVWHNSFAPHMNLNIKESEDITTVTVFFELKKSVKILLALIVLLLFAFEAVMLFHFITGQCASVLTAFIPIGMLFFVFLLSNVGLYISSKSTFKMLFAILAGNHETKVPSIHKCKFIKR